MIGNRAGELGGAVMLEGGEVRIINSTLHGNEAGNLGAAILVRGLGSEAPAKLEMLNSIVWGNTQPSGGSQVYVYNNAHTVSGIINGIVEGGCEGICINVSQADPLFVNPAAGDLRLQAGSPAINAGDNGVGPGVVDLAGNTRIQGGRVDLGAYERQ